MRRVYRQLGRAAQHLVLRGVQIEADDRGEKRRRARPEDRAPPATAHPPDVRKGKLKRLERACRRVQPAQSPGSLLLIGADEVTPGLEGIRRRAKPPLRNAELCGHLAERIHPAGAPAIEVPP